MILDAVQQIKKCYPHDVGDRPSILDTTSGELGFHHNELHKEGEVLMCDKNKNKHTGIPKYANVEPLDKTLDLLEQRKTSMFFETSKIVNIIFVDLPYETGVVGSYHVGNSDLEASEAFVKFNNRYGLTIPWTASMLLIIHIDLLTKIKKILPVEGGWVLIKTKRNEQFDLTHHIDKMMKDNGFSENGRIFYPSQKSISDKTTFHLEIDPAVKGTYLTLYRSRRKIEYAGMPTMRLHEYRNKVLPSARKDVIKMNRVFIRKCNCWMNFSKSFYSCIVKNHPTYDLAAMKDDVFGKLGEYFIFVNNQISWTVDTKFDPTKNSSMENLLSRAHNFASLRLDLANVSFIFFVELLKVFSSENDQISRRDILLKAGVKDAKDQRLFMNGSVQRLLKNVAVVQLKYGSKQGNIK